MHDEPNLDQIQKEWHGTLKAYLTGFLTCILLTAISFSLVATRLFTGPILVYTIIALALLQAIIQLLFFLHVGQEAKPRWETVVFYFMIIILLIIAVGSLWIMHDLNDRVMFGM
jgi:cytochrome o ubiquinol oxidase subunit IV